MQSKDEINLSFTILCQSTLVLLKKIFFASLAAFSACLFCCTQIRKICTENVTVEYISGISVKKGRIST